VIDSALPKLDGAQLTAPLGHYYIWDLPPERIFFGPSITISWISRRWEYSEVVENYKRFAANHLLGDFPPNAWLTRGDPDNYQWRGLMGRSAIQRLKMWRMRASSAHH